MTGCSLIFACNHLADAFFRFLGTCRCVSEQPVTFLMFFPERNVVKEDNRAKILVESEQILTL